MTELNLVNVKHSIEFIENVVKIVKQSKCNIYNQNLSSCCILGRSLYDCHEFWSDLHFEALANVINRQLTTDEYYAASLGNRCDSFNDAEWISINLFGLGVATNSELAKQTYKITKQKWLEKAQCALSFLYETSKTF